MGIQYQIQFLNQVAPKEQFKKTQPCDIIIMISYTNTGELSWQIELHTQKR